MKTVETLTGVLNASGTFTEAVGIATGIFWEHPDVAGRFLQLTMGPSGIKAKQSTAEIAIAFADLIGLMGSKETALFPTLPTPTATPSSGAAPQTVTLACSQAGASIRYTTNGDTPTEASTLYTTPVSVASPCTLKAKAFRTYWTPSAVLSAVYS
jgi:hypothetical protein